VVVALAHRGVRRTDAISRLAPDEFLHDSVFEGVITEDDEARSKAEQAVSLRKCGG
jgi:hypothetical protein